MDVDEPGLFDTPDHEPAASPGRPQRGGNRETWVRTVNAAVHIIDAEALHEAVLRVEDNALTIEPNASPDVQDAVAKADVKAAAGDAFDMLAWLIWPTDGLDELLAARAFTILSVDSAAVAEAEDRGILKWTVVVKLTDVKELRRIAGQAYPEEAESIAGSGAVAWQCAADPFAPVRSIPGIAWRPGPVEVRHLPRRVRPGTAEPP